MEPTDDLLHEWITRPQDQFIERKTLGDSSDWLKTVVTFANSVPYDKFGVLFIGVRHDGLVTDVGGVDGLQRKLRLKLDRAYPKVDYTTRVVEIGSRRCLCVIVPGSPRRPHFAGPAYVRVGSETLDATPALYEAMIAERNSKTYQIRRFIGKVVRLEFLNSGAAVRSQGRVVYQHSWQVVDCDQFCATFRDQYSQIQPIELERIDVLTAIESPGVLVLQVRN